MPLHFVEMTWPIHWSIRWKATHTGHKTNTGLGNTCKVIHLLEDIKAYAYEMTGGSPTGRQLNKSVKVFHSLTLYLLLHSS